jgi:hypothetical protein
LDNSALAYELRDDGVLYDLHAGVKLKVCGQGVGRVRVSMQCGNTIIPPETGDLATGGFRERLASLAAERFGEVNGFSEELGLVAVAFEEHLKEREEAASEDDERTNSPELVGTPYRIANGGIVRLKNTREGEVPQRLTNFTARIAEEVIRDDGAEARRVYRLKGEAGPRTLPEVEVSASQFGAMNWTADSWGLGARITAGQGAKDFAREAIELLSSGAVSRRLYAHTGWRKAESESGGRVYLHAGGAIGSDGAADGVEVELEPGLERYALPSGAPSEDEAADGLRRSFGLLEIAPDRIMAPLLAAAYLSPLSGMMTPDFALWLWGGTGSFKSTIAALVLSHFGDFEETSLPGSFESTANAQERLLFLLKDALAVVDDFRPPVSRGDASEMDRKAQRFLRTVGNRQGRGRMTADTSLRRSYPPRGVALATGESLPEGPAFASAAARSLSMNLSRGDVDMRKLSEAQATRGDLPTAMSGYIRWIAGRYDALAERAVSHRSGKRGKLRRELEGCHPRTPDAASALITALTTASAYAQSVGVLDADTGREFLARTEAGIVEAAKAHAEATKGGDPATRFVEMLASLFEGGRVFVKGKDTGKHPSGCVRLGWDETEESYEPKRGADFIGWAGDVHLYLDKDAVYAAVVSFANRGGISFGIKQRALWDSLKRSEMSLANEGRTDTTARIEKKPRRVIQIAKETVLGRTDAP